MKALYGKENNVLATFPNRTSQKKIKQFIYDYFEPLFYEECCEMYYDYRNDKRNTKYTIIVTTDDGIDYYFHGKCWCPAIENVLRKKPIILDGSFGKKYSDAVIVHFKATLKYLPKKKGK